MNLEQWLIGIVIFAVGVVIGLVWGGFRGLIGAVCVIAGTGFWADYEHSQDYSSGLLFTFLVFVVPVTVLLCLGLTLGASIRARAVSNGPEVSDTES